MSTKSVRGVLGALIAFAGLQVAMRTQPLAGAAFSVLAALAAFFVLEWVSFRKTPAKNGAPPFDAAAHTAVFRAVLVGTIVLVLATTRTLTRAWFASH